MSARRFVIDQRVRPSKRGIAERVFPETRRDQSGVVAWVDACGHPIVLWDGRKTPRPYHLMFIAPDKRENIAS